MQPHEMSSEPCEAVRLRLQAGGELTPAEMEHAEACSECMDALLESDVTAALAAKPRVRAPENFAATLALRLPPQKDSKTWGRQKALRLFGGQHAGLLSAVALLLVLLVVVTVSDPRWLAAKGPLETTLILFLLVEVAGIALWLGISPRTR